jgi:dipeptidyl aminopeptidase/acylaminoacyl peptidase
MRRTGKLAPLFILFLGVLAASAQAPLIPRSVLFGNPERMSPKVSPDGKLLAYIAPAAGVLNIWVRSIEQDGARVITADPKRGIREFHWRPDSRHILYPQDRDGDENWQLHQVHVETRAARALTPAGVQARIISIHPRFPDQAVVALNQRDARFHDAYRLDLNTGDLMLLAQNPGDVEYFIADNTLAVRAAFARMKDGGAEIRVRDSAASDWRVLTTWGPDEVDGDLLGFSADDRAVWFTSSVGSDTGRLIEMDIATGKSRVLASDPQYDAGRLLLHPSRRTLDAVLLVRERAHWEPLEAALRADFQVLKKTRNGDFEVLSRDRDDRLWTVSFLTDDGPDYFYLYDRRTRKARLLFGDRPALQRYKLPKMQPVTFRAADGMRLHGYLTLPVGARGRVPLVVVVHGGPYARDEWGFSPTVQWLANRGYGVLQINYRGSTGYGKKYLQASFRERGGKMSTDLIDGKNWAVAQGHADPKRTCMYGVSYGGYAVLVALAFTPDQFTCGVEAFGASNLVSLLKSFPPYWALYRLQWERRVGSLEKDEEFLKSRSPLFQVDRIKAPLLIGHGANDARVVQAESDQVVAALREKGKTVEYIVFPDEGHGFLRPENRTKWFAAVESFLATHLGGRAEPPAPSEDWRPLRK